MLDLYATSNIKSSLVTMETAWQTAAELFFFLKKEKKHKKWQWEDPITHQIGQCINTYPQISEESSCNPVSQGVQNVLKQQNCSKRLAWFVKLSENQISMLFDEHKP